MNKAPYGATHCYHRNGHTWWYKYSDGDFYRPSEKFDRWVIIEKGRDLNHDKWLAENLKEINLSATTPD